MADSTTTETSQVSTGKSVGVDVHMPDLSRNTIFGMVFGFFGVNMAFSLQGANMSRISQTIGADPGQLGFFFILPPLMGMIIQPLIGRWSDSIWTRWGRRMPFLLFGAPIAAFVMVLLPFSGSFGFGYGSVAALAYMAIMTCLMDVFSNISMHPFRMITGDMVNNKQKNFAWAWGEVFAYAGGILASVLPYIFTVLGVKNVAAKGVVPQSVIWAYLVSAALLIITALITILNTHEYDPETFARYHGFDPAQEAKKKRPSFVELVKKAPKAFWQLSLVQFFSWIGIMYAWTYATGVMAQNIWHTSDPSSAGYQEAGNWYGVMVSIYSVAALVFGLMYSHAKPTHRKQWYGFGLACNAIAILIVALTPNKWVAAAAFILYGFGNFTINTIPYSILTSSLDGRDEGTYLGLFNIAVCLPQIVGSLASFALMPFFHGSMQSMMIVGGIFMAISSATVAIVREGK